jgi:hypothetical protein
MLTTAIPIAPAGLGVNEWVFVMVMVAFRTPADIAAQWAVPNRELVTMAGALVGVMGVLVGMATGGLEAHPSCLVDLRSAGIETANSLTSR